MKKLRSWLMILLVFDVLLANLFASDLEATTANFWKHKKPEKLKPCEEGFTSLQCAGAESNTLVGAAMNLFAFYNDERYREVFAEQFNYMTPENATKWGQVSKEPFRYDYTNADAIIDFALENDMKVKAHALLWHQDLPPYFNEDTKPFVARVYALHHILKTAKHFKGRVYAWDVVNEAIEDDGSMRDSLLLRKLGPDYIAKAFRWARLADPKAKLFYNDYSIASFNAKSDAVYELVKDLKRRRVPIDGVGFQMHLSASFVPSVESLRANFQRFIDLGLTVNISELDVRTRDLGGGRERRLQLQKAVYQRVAYVCQELPACDGITSWGFTDKYSWIDDFFGEDDPLQYDENFEKKPAFDGQFQGLLGELPEIPDFGDNILANSSFEDGSTGWFSFGATLSTVDEPVRSGQLAIKVSERTESYQGVAVDVTNTLVPGVSYLGSAWVQVRNADVSNLNMTFKFTCVGGEDQYVGIANATANDQDWVQIVGAVTVPDCPLESAIYYLEGGDPSVDIIVDDMELLKSRFGFGENLLVNADFENGVSPFFPLAGVLEASSDEPYAGEFSARLSERTDTWNGIAYNITDIVEDAIEYQIRVFGRVSSETEQSLWLTQKTQCVGEEPSYQQLAVGVATASGWTPLSSSLFKPDCELEELLVYLEGPEAGVDLFADEFKLLPAVEFE